MSRDTPFNAGEARRRDEAAAWHVRLLAEESSESDFAAFESWIADPDNRAAFDRQDRLAAEIAGQREAMRQGLSNDIETARARRSLVRRPWVYAVAAMAAAAAFVAVLTPRPAAEKWTTYTSPATETRVVALADGSRFRLNRGAVARVAAGAKGRRVVLDRGEASFTVAHDALRPFVVETSSDRIEDVGTEFNVLTDGNRTIVTVREGAVAIYPYGAAPNSAGVRLGEGDQFRREGEAAPVLVRGADANAAFAWESGHLVYSDASLPEVVADLNRYFDPRIRIDGDEAAALRFSGVLVIDDEDRVVARLRALLPLNVAVSDKEIVLSHK